MYRLFIFAALLAFPSLAFGAGLLFETNRGRTDSRVEYLARTPAGVVFLAKKNL